MQIYKAAFMTRIGFVSMKIRACTTHRQLAVCKSFINNSTDSLYNGCIFHCL